MTVRGTPAQTIPAEERQVNLLLALRNTVVGLTAAEVVERVAGYGGRGNEAARRMFERDKGILRDLGIAITTTGRGEGSRYSIAEDDYVLPDVTLTAREASAVDLAASAWRSGELTAAARRALTKIRAVVADDPRAGGLVDLTIDLSGDEIPPRLAAAVDERRVVSFVYVSASSGTTRTRTVEPHPLRVSGAAWYLDALDRSAGAPRPFRLPRLIRGVSALSEPAASLRPGGRWSGAR